MPYYKKALRVGGDQMHREYERLWQSVSALKSGNGCAGSREIAYVGETSSPEIDILAKMRYNQ